MTTAEIKNTTDTDVPEATRLHEVRLRPVADVFRGTHEVRILLDVPGASESDVEVESHQGVLSVTARVDRNGKEQRVYERAFRLDRTMDTAAIAATLRDGVLALQIPFREEARPRKIGVNVT